MNEFAFRDDIGDALNTIQHLLRMTEDERMTKHLVGARRHLERILSEWGGEAAERPVKAQPALVYAGLVLERRDIPATYPEVSEQG